MLAARKNLEKTVVWASKSRPGTSWGASGEQVGAPKRLSRAAKREKVARSSAIFFKVGASEPVRARKERSRAAEERPGSEASEGPVCADR